MNYDDAIHELKNVNFCNHKLIRINQDIEMLRHKMTGLARDGTKLSPQQAKSSLPMPFYLHDADASPVACINAITAKEKEAYLYEQRILACEWVEDLDDQDKQILVDIYLLHARYDETAEKYGYSKKGLYVHLHSAIGKI